MNFYVNAVSGIVTGGTVAGLKSFTLFHKLPKGISLLWKTLNILLVHYLAKFSFATLI